jgi:hypothetical protein
MFLMLSGLGGTDGKIAYGWLGNVDPNSRFPGNGFDFANTFDFGDATVNANTTYSVAGHVSAPGFSPHIYSAIEGDVSPEVQLALVEGTLALQTQSFDPVAFPELAGFMDAGDVVFIDPLVLLAFYSQYLPFPPGSAEYDQARLELEGVLFGVQNPLVITEDGASAGGDDILFPHFPIEGITLQIAFTLPQIDPETGEFVGTTLEIASQVIPEPGSIALVVVGLVGAVALRRRRRRAA